MIIIQSSKNPIVDVLRPAQKLQVWNTYIPVINGICADGEQAKAEERKCSDSWVVQGQISVLLRLVGSKLSDITCTCLALDLAINARAGHFTDSVRNS